jgi:hypothetical protein
VSGGQHCTIGHANAETVVGGCLEASYKNVSFMSHPLKLSSFIIHQPESAEFGTTALEIFLTERIDLWNEDPSTKLVRSKETQQLTVGHLSALC